MTISISNLTSGKDETTPAYEYTTASVAAGGAATLILSVVHTYGGATGSVKSGHPQVEGLGVQWTNILDSHFNGNTNRNLSVFVAYTGAGVAPGAITITLRSDIDDDGSMPNGIMWVVDIASPALLLPQVLPSVSTTNPVSQLYGSFRTGSVAYAVAANTSSVAASMSARSGWSELAEMHYSTSPAGLETQWKTASDTAAECLSSGGTPAWAFLALEIAPNTAHIKRHPVDDEDNHTFPAGSGTTYLDDSGAFSTPPGTGAGVYQPLDSDLTAIAALSTTSFGRALLTLADASALRTSGGLVLGTDIYSKAAVDAGFQPLDSDLTAIAALSTTSYGRSLLASADASALRTLAGLVLGTDIYSKSAVDSGFQPLDSDLTSIAALSTTSFGRSLLAAADAAALRTLAGLATVASSGSHADLSSVSANQHHNQAHVIDASDHTVSGKTAGQFLRALTATTFGFEAIPQSLRVTFVSPASAITVVAWRVPYACTVTAVKGYRVGGTGATVNAGKNGSTASVTSTFLASALSLTNDDTGVQDGGSVQNTALVAGDVVFFMLVSVSGSPTQVMIEVDLTRP